jgi:hypothetical protein
MKKSYHKMGGENKIASFVQELFLNSIPTNEEQSA